MPPTDIPAPTAEDRARDAEADWQLCEALPRGDFYNDPGWYYDGRAFILCKDGTGPILEVRGACRFHETVQDAIGKFAAESRAALPAYLRLLADARRRIAELERDNRRLRADLLDTLPEG